MGARIRPFRRPQRRLYGRLHLHLHLRLQSFRHQAVAAPPRKSPSDSRRTMAMSSKLLLIAAGVILLPACNTTKNIGQEDPGLGEAVKYNSALQTINPEP